MPLLRGRSSTSHSVVHNDNHPVKSDSYKFAKPDTPPPPLLQPPVKKTAPAPPPPLHLLILAYRSFSSTSTVKEDVRFKITAGSERVIFRGRLKLQKRSGQAKASSLEGKKCIKFFYFYKNCMFFLSMYCIL
ncbi:unnamed protein product [Eruca vesicaria subsp. sativa]|uniref:Uncharacterized protein n=1 Tax=Eruca vesicaria subsp. sativa TaxID=29727 RepID=A0ABC8IYQ7_ERUVS|nr:unnamed protein product [Eruca vesicaria subsp. sativa]